MSEYGEPWRIDGIGMPDDRIVEYELIGPTSRAFTDDEDLAERITVCINACAGIPTEDLVSGKVKVVIDTRTIGDYITASLQRAKDSYTGFVEGDGR